MKMPRPTEDFVAQAAGYHSAQDMRHMQALVQAMLAERRHLALTSPHGPTLEHYSRLLVRDLRQQAGVKVIPHLPGSADKLLQSFNELLADVPLAEVVDRGAGAQRPVHVVVATDSPALAPQEFALLVRLVNDLPGANLRLVLVQERDQALGGPLEALGPSVLHWRIQPPGADAGEDDPHARAAAREALREALREPPGAEPAPSLPAAAAPKALFSQGGRWGRKARAARADTPPELAAVTARPVMPAASRQPAAPGAAARRNRLILAGGLTASAGLAVALALWLSSRPTAPRAAAQPATPAAVTAPALPAAPPPAAPFAASAPTTP